MMWTVAGAVSKSSHLFLSAVTKGAAGDGLAEMNQSVLSTPNINYWLLASLYILSCHVDCRAVSAQAGQLVG